MLAITPVSADGVTPEHFWTCLATYTRRYLSTAVCFVLPDGMSRMAVNHMMREQWLHQLAMRARPHVRAYRLLSTRRLDVWPTLTRVRPVVTPVEYMTDADLMLMMED
jgi:hypothetical protein